MAADPGSRASDDDRDRTASLLREHHAAGRLDAEEFNERLDKPFAAKTVGELDELLPTCPPSTCTGCRRCAARTGPGTGAASATAGGAGAGRGTARAGLAGRLGLVVQRVGRLARDLGADRRGLSVVAVDRRPWGRCCSAAGGRRSSGRWRPGHRRSTRPGVRLTREDCRASRRSRRPACRPRCGRGAGPHSGIPAGRAGCQTWTGQPGPVRNDRGLKQTHPRPRCAARLDTVPRDAAGQLPATVRSRMTWHAAWDAIRDTGNAATQLRSTSSCTAAVTTSRKRGGYAQERRCHRDRGHGRRAAPERHVPGGAGQRAQGPGPHQRQDAACTTSGSCPRTGSSWSSRRTT